MMKDLTLKDIAGFATEKTVWQLMLNLSNCCGQGKFNNISPESIVITENGYIVKDGKGTTTCKAFVAPEEFVNKQGTVSEPSEIWSIGALAFYAITAVDVFEGKGGETQTEETEVPRLSSTHASRELSRLIHACMSYSPDGRPSREEIHAKAESALSKPTVPNRKLTSVTGKRYTSSLVKFWPEEMIPILMLCVYLLYPSGLSAQIFDKSAIPQEMASLVMRCIDLRLPQNISKVSKEMDRDMNWTMMDELTLDKKGECTTKDMVDMFGLNDMGFSILKRHGGVTNAGGRFRDGRDPRYKFSFIEITVKQGLTVNYNISGREGKQIFAIIPFEKDAKFVASIPDGETFIDDADGVYYINMKKDLKKSDSFTLEITNQSNKNMAFAIINYNSRKHE